MSCHRCCALGALATALSFLSLSSCANGDCVIPHVSAGQQRKWPIQNPALVAPVTAVYNYHEYNAPLPAMMTDRSIRFDMPETYHGGFRFQATPSEENDADEVYSLKHIELRKPAKVPAGGQVLEHSLEAVLIHKQVNGDNFASVIIPFIVGQNLEPDMLSVITDGAELPHHKTQLTHVMRMASQCLNLNSIWEGGDFLHHWNTLPSDCADKAVHTRQLMRNGTITTSLNAYKALMEALKDVDDVPPADSPEVAWAVGTCRSPGLGCNPKKAEGIQWDLAVSTKTLQERKQEFADHKAALEDAMGDLEVKKVGAYEFARVAESNLENSHSTLTSAQTNFDRLSGWSKQAAGLVWDSDAPHKDSATSSAVEAATNTPSVQQALLEVSSMPLTLATNRQEKVRRILAAHGERSALHCSEEPDQGSP